MTSGPTPTTPAPSAERPSDFVGSIPEAYDRYLGPFFFDPFARHLAQRLTLARTATGVLEIAAGTGVLTEQLRRRVPSEVRLVATDLHASMLDVAQRRVQRGGGVDFREADAQALPFPDGMFDAVICQFGVMLFPDKPLAAREARRVLKPGGEWLFSVWGSLADNPVARIVNDLVTNLFRPDPPLFYQTPFGFSDPVALKALAEDAGFNKVMVSDVRLPVRSPSPMDAATGLIQGNPVLNAILEHDTRTPDDVTRAVAVALAKEFGTGPLQTTMLARVVSARA